MRLASIKLAGFKSFVDPTVINFASNLTAVVGPNGCGKSNVIDAVKWVMGESSAKSLRGDLLVDVIFNGSTSRKPIGQASVELRFDNIDGAIGGEFADYNEISIKRLVTRDGESTYFLNGTKCRKRDITDIFLGTGLGPRSYAIIEQGMISRFIEAKPDDLRVYLEEAAGISKYKERRRETENRIKHTRENLTRLLDLQEELDKQLQRLEKQSQTAERYNELRLEEAVLTAQCYALNWQDLNAQIEEKESILRENGTQLEAHCAGRQNIDTQLEKERITLSEQREQLQNIQKKFYAQANEITRLEQKYQHHLERSTQLQRDKEANDQALQHALAQLTGDETQISLLQNRLQELEPSILNSKQEEQLIYEQLQSVEAEMETWRHQFEILNQKAQEASKIAEIEKAKIAQLESRMAQAAQQIQKLELEAKGLINEDLQLEISKQTEEERKFDESSREIDGKVKSAITEREQLREKQRSLTKEIQAQAKQLANLNQRKAQLEALQQVALGKENKSVVNWLTKLNLNTSTRLAEILTAEIGFEIALETVLGDALEAICLEKSADLSFILQETAELDSGRVQFFIGTADHSQGSQTKQLPYSTLLDHVTLQNSLENQHIKDSLFSILMNVYVVEDLKTAFEVQQQLQNHQSVITKDGIWLGVNFARINRGVSSDATGVLARKNELHALLEVIDKESEKQTELEQTLQIANDALTHAEQQVEQLQRQKFEISQRLREVVRILSSKKMQFEQFSSRRVRIQHDLQENNQHLEKWQMEASSARVLLQSALDNMALSEQERNALTIQKDPLMSQVQLIRATAKDKKEQVFRIEMETSNIKAELKGVQQNSVRQQEHIAQLRASISKNEQELEQNNQPIASIKQELDDQLTIRLKNEEELRLAREMVLQKETEFSTLEQNKAQLEDLIQKAREGLEEIKLSTLALTVHRQTAIENLAKTSYTLEQLLQELNALSPAPILSEWQEKLTKVQQRMERLGPINLAAIEEYQSSLERKMYLDSQCKDLNEALETLENAIRKIDKETKARFKETFDKVNDEFKRLFPRLFGGGQASLELTGEDLLETGVKIQARPPGKKNSTIHLLSGGEKALTAVALVFSIFHLNPAPFCLLDEVDAPLDDNNVGRFCDMVKEMSQAVQFIFISHNKLAMEMAHQLHGVTMREPGVSRMVSVDIEEATQLATA